MKNWLVNLIVFLSVFFAIEACNNPNKESEEKSTETPVDNFIGKWFYDGNAPVHISFYRSEGKIIMLENFDGAPDQRTQVFEEQNSKRLYSQVDNSTKEFYVVNENGELEIYQNNMLKGVGRSISK